MKKKRKEKKFGCLLIYVWVMQCKKKSGSAKDVISVIILEKKRQKQKDAYVTRI